MTVLLRFAPSPTGALHLGGLRTALYNYLYAKKNGGKLILRIEDTDTSRTVPGAVDGIRKAFEWARLDYDYGPGADGPHGPYFQSQRLDLYRSYADRLLDSGHAYRCFCSPDTLAATREKLARSGSNSTYDKACLHLTDEEVARRVRAGDKHIIRFNDGRLPVRPATQDIVFKNLRDAHASLPTDPVLLKSDSFPTYHLASVVDDSAMGITHVVRGEEWLPSFPLHLDLYAALSIRPPLFAHLPILLNPDGSKMSKRKGDVHVLDYAQRGWEPEAVLNWLALAGWGVQHDATSSPSSPHHAPDSTTVMHMDEMIQKFDFSVLTQRRSILDPTKLEYLNSRHLEYWLLHSSSRNRDALVERAMQIVKDSFPDCAYVSPDYLSRILAVLHGRMTKLLDIPELTPFFFKEPDYHTPEAQKMCQTIAPDTYKVVVGTLASALQVSPDWTQSQLEKSLHDVAATSGLKQKEFMTIVRHSLTGAKTGPSVMEVMWVLGHERAITRLRGTL